MHKMIIFFFVLIFSLISCKTENISSPVDSVETLSLEVSIFTHDHNSKKYLPNIQVTLDSTTYITNKNGMVQYDSLVIAEYQLLVENADYLTVDTLLNLNASQEIEVELLNIANDISWIRINGYKGGQHIKMTSHPEGYVLASSMWTKGAGIYKLNSGDTSWVHLAENDVCAPLLVSSKGTILTYDKRSEDGGTTWSDLNFEPIYSFMEINNIIYVGGYETGMNFGYSEDDGINWKENNLSDKPMSIFTNAKKEVLICTESYGLFKLDFPIKIIDKDFKTHSATMDDQGYLYAGNNKILRSKNNGYNWEVVLEESEYYQGYYEFTTNSVGHIFAAKYGEGVLRSLDNGESWERINQGLERWAGYQLLIDSKNYLYAIHISKEIIYRTKLPTIKKES